MPGRGAFDEAPVWDLLAAVGADVDGTAAAIDTERQRPVRLDGVVRVVAGPLTLCGYEPVHVSVTVSWSPDAASVAEADNDEDASSVSVVSATTIETNVPMVTMVTG